MKTFYLALYFALAQFAPAQVSISASKIANSFGQSLPSARLCFVPVDGSKIPIGFRVGTAQIVPNESCGKVTLGTLESGLSLEPSASGTQYHIYLKQGFSNTVVYDYGYAPITGASW